MSTRDYERSKAVVRQIKGVRDLINHSLVHGQLFKDQPAFNRVCSAMDLVDDTTMAIQAYLDPASSDELPRAYLLVHGLYQSVSTLLYSCKTIADRMGCTLSPELVQAAMRIQDIRVEVSGHPYDTKPNEKSGRKGGAHGIAQYSLGLGGFRLYRWFDDGSSDIVNVSHSEVVRSTFSVARRALKQIIRCLQAKVRSLEEEWMKSPTETHFKGVGYACEKLIQGVRTVGHEGYGLFGLGEISKCLDALDGDQRLTDHWRHELEGNSAHVRLAIERLREHLNGADRMPLEESEIYARYVIDRIDDLWKMCRGLDQAFSEDNKRI